MDDTVPVSARPSRRSAAPHVEVRGELFGAVAPPSRRRGLWWLINASLLAHVALGSALVLVPLYFPSVMPYEPESLRVILAPPPPPPPPPAPARSARAQVQPHPPVVVPAQPAVLTAPREIPQSDPRPADTVGLDDGSDMGVPEGMPGGVEGGIPGGVAGGVLGGVLGGVGDGPVLDYDQPPRLLRPTKPTYPQEAFVKKIEGTVQLQILIDSTGKVADARVVRSIPLLDAAAIHCVRQWIFAPAMKNGRPVATYAEAPIRFTIY